MKPGEIQELLNAAIRDTLDREERRLFGLAGRSAVEYSGNSFRPVEFPATASTMTLDAVRVGPDEYSVVKGDC